MCSYCLTFYILSRRAQVQQQDDETGSAQGYELVERAGVEYEEIDEPRDQRRELHSQGGEYEFSQCAAYLPMHANFIQQDDVTGSSQGYEPVGSVGAGYEEIDEPRHPRRESLLHDGEYELTQCAAYIPMHTN